MPTWISDGGRLTWRGRVAGWLVLWAIAYALGLPWLYAAALTGLPWLLLKAPPHKGEGLH